MAKKKKGKKGTFGSLGLPVSKQYVIPISRGKMVMAGLLALMLLVGFAAVNFFFQRGGFLSNGPMSSQHAGFAGDCATCHTAFGSVTDEKCAACHEVFGDELGVYSYASHYLYRSNDFQRVVPQDHEQPCSACHPEHEGRLGDRTRVEDQRCESCHAYAPFAKNHPQMAFVTQQGGVETETLKFPHIHHVRELMEREAFSKIEEACLFCHQPERDGKHFKPLSFDAHCDSCHLTATTTTPRLAIASQPGQVGVQTLEAIKTRGGPGTSWTNFANSAEFKKSGNRLVSKTPVHHRDPWIMDNLRRLRGLLYDNAGLVDLLRSTADVPPEDVAVLYQEAIDSLEETATGLRSNADPTVQTELAKIAEAIKALRVRLSNPYTSLDETKFLLDLAPDPSLEEDLRVALEEVVTDLTQPCSECHFVENATIVRVQKDQRALKRAEFNHRAHVLTHKCLDCHTEIPFTQYLASQSAEERDFDGAAIINLPKIEKCSECHQPDLASDRCITCHEFHPHKNRQSKFIFSGDGLP